MLTLSILTMSQDGDSGGDIGYDLNLFVMDEGTAGSADSHNEISVPSQGGCQQKGGNCGGGGGGDDGDDGEDEDDGADYAVSAT